MTINKTIKCVQRKKTASVRNKDLLKDFTESTLRYVVTHQPAVTPPAATVWRQMFSVMTLSRCVLMVQAAAVTQHLQLFRLNV